MKLGTRIFVIVVLVAVLVGLIGFGYSRLIFHPEYEEGIVWWDNGIIEGELRWYRDFDETVEVNIDGFIMRTSWDNVILLKYDEDPVDEQ